MAAHCLNCGVRIDNKQENLLCDDCSKDSLYLFNQDYSHSPHSKYNDDLKREKIKKKKRDF